MTGDCPVARGTEDWGARMANHMHPRTSPHLPAAPARPGVTRRSRMPPQLAPGRGWFVADMTAWQMVEAGGLLGSRFFKFFFVKDRP